MLRIGKLTDYATVILATLAADRSRLQNAGSLAERTHIAAPTVSKLLKQLHRARAWSIPRAAPTAATSWRAHPEDISAAAILDALEGPLALTECSVRQRALRHRTQLLGRPNLAAAQSWRSAVRSAKSRWRNSPAWTTGRRTMPIERELKHTRRARRCRHELEGTVENSIDALLGKSYRHGFVTDIDSDTLPPGLDEDVVRFISRKKREPEFMTEWRLKAYRHWLTMREPHWAKLRVNPIDYQSISYFSAPKRDPNAPKSLEEVDPKLLATYEKLGVPLHERARLAGVAVDAVFDSVSVATTFKERLAEAGVIFCSFSDAVQNHPALIEQYLGTVVPQGDNFFAALNSAVFSDGSFVYVPKGVRCPMELSTYFRINAKNTGQFERTLIIAAPGSHVSYLEGCTAPMRDENQLHAAVVELIAEDDAEIKYSTVQNWYPGDENGVGGIYNFVTKRGECRGRNSKISWTQVETGSAITWKYPSCVLRGENSVGAFYSWPWPTTTSRPTPAPR